MTTGVPTHVGELDADNEGLLRKGVPPYPAVDIPDQRAHIQLIRVKIAREPPLAPGAELANDRCEFYAGWRQSILGSAAVALDHSGVGELAKPG